MQITVTRPSRENNCAKITQNYVMSLEHPGKGIIFPELQSRIGGCVMSKACEPFGFAESNLC